MRGWWACAAACLLGLSGCLDDEGREVAAGFPAPIALAVDDVSTTSQVCPCDPILVLLPMDTPAGSWLAVRVAWDGTQVDDIGLNVTQGSSRVTGTRGFDDRIAILRDAQPGLASVQVDGRGPMLASFAIRDLEAPTSGDLLPNLVELAIVNPHMGTCDAVEQSEQGARKCMRFGNGVGNPGDGALQVRLTVEQAAMALAPLKGHFVQEVRQADGTVRAQDVGPASFHLAHGHWHYDGLALFELFTVDPGSMLRGGIAAAHGKSGFCFLDWDKMRENETEPAQRERAETDCLIPGLPGLSPTVGSWTNGISRGWYDFYGSYLSDQYVDVDGVPDGLYELVATADPLRTLQEMDETDNQSSLLLRLSGGGVEILEERGHFHVQDDDA